MHLLQMAPPSHHPRSQRRSRRSGLASPPIPALTTALAFALAAPLALSAQSESTEPEDDTALDLRVDVYATAPELVSAEEIDAGDLRASGEDALGRALRDQQGLDATRRGPINLDPTVRGLAEDQLAIGVDGSRTFAAGPGRMDSDLAHVSPHAVQSVQVVKGPYALSWGAGAMSAIDVRTFRPALGGPSLGGRAAVDYESNAEAIDAYGALFGSSERWRWTLLANTRQGSDYEAGDGSVVPADYESNDLRGAFGLRLGEGGLLEISGGYQGQDDIDYAGRILDATYFKTRSYNAEYSWSGSQGALESVRAQVYANHKDHLMNNDEKPTALDMPGRIPPFGLDVDLPTESNTRGARLEAGFAGADPSSSWTFGIDHFTNERNARRFVRRRSNDLLLFEDIVWPDAELQDTGVWGRGTWNRERMSLSAALRVDLVDFGAGETSEFFAANTNGSLEQSEENVSASLGARFQLRDAWIASLGLGRAVRTANALERASDRFPSTRFQIGAEFLGEPLLDPERSLQLDAGIERRTARWRLRANAFWRQIDDYITVVPDPSLPRRLPLSPPVVFRYVNGEGAEYLGGELWLSHRPADWLEWQVGYETVDGDDETYDEPLFGIAPDEWTASVTLSNRPGTLTARVLGTLIRSQDDVSTTRLERPTDGAELVDLQLAWRPPRVAEGGLELQLAVENLTDEAYSRHLSSLNPFTGQRILEEGRSVRVGVRWSR